MGLDVYVGPLTRYTAGEWLTAIQQAGLDAGQQVRIVRSTPEPEDIVTDPDEIQHAVQAWQTGLLQALDGGEAWAEHVDLPYSTDKPDWDGYGGLLLLAAYDEMPQLAPTHRTGPVIRKRPADTPRSWQESPAYQEAAKNPERYPSLLSGVEWWLPNTSGPSVFSAPRLTGQPTTMGRIDDLVSELRTLAHRVGIDAGDLDRARHNGIAPGSADVELAGRFGLAVFLALALTAQDTRQPLLLDY